MPLSSERAPEREKICSLLRDVRCRLLEHDVVERELIADVVEQGKLVHNALIVLELPNGGLVEARPPPNTANRPAL